MIVSAFIPARLESKRFPNKVLKPIYGIPMIEHVRRRAILSKVFNKVVIVTNSKIIKKKLLKYKANVIMTKKRHLTGTSRVSEISNKYRFDFGCILFADEPFLNPYKLSNCIKKLKLFKKEKVFNLTTNLKYNDLESKNVVKTTIDRANNIIEYYRKPKTKKYPKKILKKSSGILIFKKNIIDNYNKLKSGSKEKRLKIEQYRLLENNIKIKSIFLKDIHPSINTKKEFKNLLSLINENKEELKILTKTKKLENKIL